MKILSHVVFFWNIIIDSNNIANKQLMNNFVNKTQELIDFFTNKNSIIITTQIFDSVIKDKAIYTTLRFSNMYKYLTITNKPIIQSDIDFDKIQNLSIFVNNILKYDIALFKILDVPWRKVCATLSYFSNIDVTEKFVYIFNTYLNYFYKKDSNNWFIDQLCLTFTYYYLCNNLEAEYNMGSIYKYSENVFNYSTPYKRKTLELYNNFNSNVSFSPTNIFIYWDSNSESQPKVVKQSINSWIIKNPNQYVHVLNDTNLFEDNYINIKNIYKFLPNYDILKQTISKQALSDIIRLYLLYTYNGIWVDATVFCNKSLSLWIDKITKHNFFAFTIPGTVTLPNNIKEVRLIDTWFLFSNNSYIIKSWFNKCIEFWNNIDNKENNILFYENGKVFYFWVHCLFNYLYKIDMLFKAEYNKCDKIHVDSPQFLEHIHHNHKYILDNLTDEAKEHIDSISSPIYKLTWKFDKNKIKENNYTYKDSVLEYLFKKNGIYIDNFE